MNRRIAANEPLTFLGIEGGGTRSVALLADAAGAVLHRASAGPANLRLLSDAQLVRLFRSFRQQVGLPAALGIGLAGARTQADRERIRQAAARVWPGVPCYATNDLETGLMAATPAATGRQSRSRAARHAVPAEIPRVLVLSGTGSCCFGRAASGETVKVGGWGHVLGDQASGYDIGMTALRTVIETGDRTGIWPRLGRRVLRSLQFNEPNELIDWAFAAAKTDIAAVAVEVFAANRERDPLARRILDGAADRLAADAVACARRVAKPGQLVRFVFAGGTLLKQPRFAAGVAARLRKRWPKAIITPLQRESVWGAVELAKLVAPELLAAVPSQPPSTQPVPTTRELIPLESLVLSPTEQRNPRSMNLDQLPLSEAIALMISEDARIPRAIRKERARIEQAIHWIVRAFRRGGRLFYVGAGTSGRLGVLDASECPPTFRASPEMVQGIIAGGQSAIWSAAEGAEDDPGAGARAIEFRGVTRRDVVVGIAASGRTPFVWGALEAAKRRGAKTVLLCFNPSLQVPRARRPDLLIAVNAGPEILTGSTRLKAGTATKLILNMLTTLAMVRIGKVRSNLMVDVKASNVKLRDRAVRITRELAGVDYEAAHAALERTHWDIKGALAQLRRRRS